MADHSENPGQELVPILQRTISKTEIVESEVTLRALRNTLNAHKRKARGHILKYNQLLAEITDLEGDCGYDLPIPDPVMDPWS